MFLDDSEPVKKPEIILRKLDTLSVKGLEDYIIELEVEITRAKQEITKRGSARSKAEAVFGKKPEET
jgi:uncharacterized small protein (DUF1192 family)